MQLRDSAAAEDIAADVFEAAFKAYTRAQPDPDTVHVWLYRIARNRVFNHRRSARRLHAMIGRVGRESKRTADVEGAALMRSEVRAVLDALTILKTRDRELVGLRIAGDLTYREIGELTGMSEHAAMMATRRACDRVRDAMKERE
jgi:RNA polymerase sigma-70 factor (ECF subfamily)